jgi:hypothetical protein
MAEACDGSASEGRGALSSAGNLAGTSHNTAGTRPAGSDPGAVDSQEIASPEIGSLGVRLLEAAASSSGTSVVKFAPDAALALAFTPRSGWCERGVAGF